MGRSDSDGPTGRPAARWLPTGLNPTIAAFELPPEWVLVLFLPAILYWEALTTSTRTASRDARSVVLLAVVLVVATTAAVAACLHWILDIPWAVAFVVGAVLAPTDAAAIAALAQLLPPRFMTLLRAESLINDGTALALLATAVPVAIGARHLDLLHISWAFAASYLGGVVFGVAVAGTALVAHRFLRDWMLSSVLSVLTPFVVYLLAEQIHTSGVIAVVTASFLLARRGPRVIPPATRMQTQPFWSLTTYVLNSGLFVLVGTQIPSAVDDLAPQSLIGRVGSGCLGRFRRDRLSAAVLLHDAFRVSGHRPPR
ncbi:cation:proton antiporter [Rhodococcus koreensis]|nr:cation:proton antiporter [Rhodococcus koreensis]